MHGLYSGSDGAAARRFDRPHDAVVRSEVRAPRVNVVVNVSITAKSAVGNDPASRARDEHLRTLLAHHVEGSRINRSSVRHGSEGDGAVHSGSYSASSASASTDETSNSSA